MSTVGTTQSTYPIWNQPWTCVEQLCQHATFVEQLCQHATHIDTNNTKSGAGCPGNCM